MLLARTLGPSTSESGPWEHETPLFPASSGPVMCLPFETPRNVVGHRSASSCAILTDEVGLRSLRRPLALDARIETA
jgi:hypothetical protein